jgi:hypothetical protein
LGEECYNKHESVFLASVHLIDEECLYQWLLSSYVNPNLQPTLTQQ